MTTSIAKTANGNSIAAASTQQRFAGVLLSSFLGMFVLYGVGFEPASHDTSHDSRHAFVFPCH